MFSNIINNLKELINNNKIESVGYTDLGDGNLLFSKYFSDSDVTINFIIDKNNYKEEFEKLIYLVEDNILSDICEVMNDIEDDDINDDDYGILIVKHINKRNICISKNVYFDDGVRVDLDICVTDMVDQDFITLDIGFIGQNKCLVMISMINKYS